MDEKANEPMICPRFERAAELLGRKWVGLIVGVLVQGPCRFRKFGAQVPHLSDRLLSKRLRELEAEGIVRREVHATRPVRIEYSLTPKGRDLAPVIETIQIWANRWVVLEEATEQPAHTPS